MKPMNRAEFLKISGLAAVMASINGPQELCAEESLGMEPKIDPSVEEMKFESFYTDEIAQDLLNFHGIDIRNEFVKSFKKQ